MKPGVVKWFSSEKGFGFIVPEGGGEDVFVHARIVRASGLNPVDLKDGTALTYEPGIGRKGVQAIRIALAA